MAQSDALYESLTAEENPTFFGEMKGMAKQQLQAEIAKVAQVVDLTNTLSKRVGEYSRGMKRRLSLAIALLNTNHILKMTCKIG